MSKYNLIDIYEQYQIGSGFTRDFDYAGMLNAGLKTGVDTDIEILRKMSDDFEDVNYHRENNHLQKAIDALEEGAIKEASMFFGDFHAEIKSTMETFDMDIEPTLGKFMASKMEENEAVDLANVLRAGKLPARAEIVQADVVGPSLGKEAIDSGMTSFLIALTLVLLWMVFYYGKSGIFSDIALILNILLIFGVLSGLGAVLTLPGIAGIVLTIGIAVDANVLIYERVREELTKGKGQKEAVKDGFSNALSSILDANITTGLTALILFVFGTGPIKGFATTLLIGIVTSLFTAIFITRLLIDWYANKGGNLDFSTSVTKGLFRNININFLKKRRVSYLISTAIIIGGLGSLFTTGLDEGIDFVGGRTYTVRFAQDVNAEEVSESVVATFGSGEIKTIGGANQLKISTKYKIDENSPDVDEEVQNKLYESLSQYLPDGITYDEFSSPQGNVGIMYSGKVSPTIADDIKKSSIWAILGSLIVVFLYILIRFKKWQFSLGAVAAVFHDVLIVLGIFSITWNFFMLNLSNMRLHECFSISNTSGISIIDCRIGKSPFAGCSLHNSE